MVRLLLLVAGAAVAGSFAFNPTMVRLLLVGRGLTCRRDFYFQSHNGAIAAISPEASALHEISFNPTMVRLLLFQETHWLPLGCAPFNPTMVRLLPSSRLRLLLRFHAFQSHNGAIAAETFAQPCKTQKIFQSHNGAIAAYTKLLGVTDEYYFQSHNGAIAAEQRSFNTLHEASFNPTMVRLLLTLVQPKCRNQPYFQSHNGAIAAPPNLKCN